MGMRSFVFLVSLFASVSSGSTLQSAQREYVPNASMQRVIGMLDQLVADMDAEQVEDDKQFEAFTEWCGRQKEVTSRSIEELQALIEDLTAQLARLYSQKAELEAAIASLNAQIQQTQTQIQVATEKRGEEHQSFLTEQQNFDASIAACGRAVELLKAHYGEPAQPAERPAWMSLMQEAAGTLRRTVAQHKMQVHPGVMVFLQQPTEFGRYQAATGDANNIVAQMQELSDTFASDKQSSINDENKLQGMYNKLMEEKTTLLNTLIAERDSRQKVLNKVNEEIASTEGAKAAAEGELEDEQTYLAQINKSCQDAAMMYEMRKHDRQQETMAVGEAKKVLAPQVGSSLVEVDRSTRRIGHKAAGTLKIRGRARFCKSCDKAASMLLQAARAYSSEVLAAAATAATQNDAIKDIIAALDGLLTRLHEDQKMEDKHKEWCETELSETTQRKAQHEGLVASLTAQIADLTETIAEKVQDLQENADAIALADKNFAEATAIRENDHSEFEIELKNYVDALSALNSAIDILAKFYSSKGASLLQLSRKSMKVAPREMAPGVFSNVYEQKGGKGVIEMIATVRTEFETGKRDLEAAEKQAQADYEQAKADYQKMRRDLVSTGDRLTVEKQTAESELDQAREDKATNEQEVAAAQSYLVQLGSSCNILLKNYDSRKQQRADEEKAIEDAKKVLEEEA